MKMIRVTLIAFIAFSIFASVYADSITSGDTNVKPVIDTIIKTIDSTSVDSSSVIVEQSEGGFFSSFDFSKMILFAFGIFELVVRLYPTEKNYSILSIVNSIVNYIVPNKKKQGGTH